MKLDVNVPELGKALNALQECSRVMAELTAALEKAGAVPTETLESTEEQGETSPPKKRKRRTKAEMQAAREAESKSAKGENITELRASILGRMRALADAGHDREPINELVFKHSESTTFKDIPDSALKLFDKEFTELEKAFEAGEEEGEDGEGW